MKSIHKYLEDLREAVSDIQSFTADGQGYFMTDRKTQLAVIRSYEVIGEIVKRLPQNLLEAVPTVDWKAIKGFRDILIHQYDNVDLSIVWDAIERLPTLQAAIETLLAGLPPDDEPS